MKGISRYFKDIAGHIPPSDYYHTNQDLLHKELCYCAKEAHPHPVHVKIIVKLREDTYTWNPKEDITAYELALCVPVLLTTSNFPVVDELPETVRRHFDKQT